MKRNGRTTLVKWRPASATSLTARRRRARSISPCATSWPACTGEHSSCCMPESPFCVNQRPSCLRVRRLEKQILSAFANAAPRLSFHYPKPPETAMERALQAAMPWHQRLKAWLEMPPVQRILVALILVNAVILGLETNATVMASWGPFLTAADKAILAVFVIEITLRLIAHRLSFFRDPWSVFDFAV